MKKIFLALLSSALVSTALLAQDAPQSTDQSAPLQDQNTQQDQMPIFRVHVYARSTKAVNYRHRGGSTTVDFRGTDLMPEVSGHAKIDGKVGRLAIGVELKNLRPATTLGGQYLTYVLWAITTEGRAVNLGEVLPGENGKEKIDVTTHLQGDFDARLLAGAMGGTQ